jgi:hypothetical protein
MTNIPPALAAHIRQFVEHPHPRLLNQPVCPFARRARTTGRVDVVALPFSPDDDSAVAWAVEQFDPASKDVLLVVHPDACGLTYFELAELRDRFAEHLAGRYEVFTGHPADPYTRNGLPTRREPYPVLHFVPVERMREAEAKLGPRRQSLGE